MMKPPKPINAIVFKETETKPRKRQLTLINIPHLPLYLIPQSTIIIYRARV